jgi:hypothetical protein
MTPAVSTESQATAFAHALAQAHGGSLPGSGLPADRHARLAARRAFVALKRSYLHVMEDVPGHALLRAQICRAEGPEDLWSLRAPVFAALAGPNPDHRGRRQLLHRGLDSMFSSLQDSNYSVSGGLDDGPGHGPSDTIS